MKETGKFNKRNADHIREELIRLKRIESQDGQHKSSDVSTEGMAGSEKNSEDDQEESKEVLSDSVG